MKTEKKTKATLSVSNFTPMIAAAFLAAALLAGCGQSTDTSQTSQASATAGPKTNTIQPAQKRKMSPPSKPTEVKSGDYTLSCSSTSWTTGGSDLTLLLTGKDGKPVSDASMTAVFIMTSMDMGKAEPPVWSTGPGAFSVSINPTMDGPWQLQITAKISGKPHIFKIDGTAKSSTGSPAS